MLCYNSYRIYKKTQLHRLTPQNHVQNHGEQKIVCGFLLTTQQQHVYQKLEILYEDQQQHPTLSLLTPEPVLPVQTLLAENASPEALLFENVIDYPAQN